MNFKSIVDIRQQRIDVTRIWEALKATSEVPSESEIMEIASNIVATLMAEHHESLAARKDALEIWFAGEPRVTVELPHNENVVAPENLTYFASIEGLIVGILIMARDFGLNS